MSSGMRGLSLRENLLIRLEADILKKTVKRAIACELAALVTFMNYAVMSAHAEGDIAGAIESTWNQAKGQIKAITNNVIFPVIDVILVILLFVRLGLLYLEYRKHNDLEWTPVAILFGCLLFTLTAPLYIWTVVNI